MAYILGMTCESARTYRGQCWISDMGSETVLTRDDGETMTLPRHGVWCHERGMRKPGVVEVSDDLDGLMEKYKVPADRVFNLRRRDAAN